MGGTGVPLETARHDAVSGDRIAVVRCTRARTLHALARATRDMFGDPVERELLAAIPSEARALDDHEWLSIDHLERFCELAWEGPLGGNLALLRTWTDRMIDHGFGRVRRLLLTIATPAGLVRRAGELWRDEHTDGRLIAYSTSPKSAIATLHEHDFIGNPLMRQLVAETFRYSLELAGARGAQEAHHAHANGTLVVNLTW